MILVLYNIGDSPDDINVDQIGSSVHIYVKRKDIEKVYKQVATIDGVHNKIRIETNIPGKFTDILIDHKDKNRREVIATVLNNRTWATIEEIEAVRPICPYCGIRTKLVGGEVFNQVHQCTKCGRQI